MSPKERVKPKNLHPVFMTSTPTKKPSDIILLRPIIEELKRGYKGYNYFLY